MSIQTCTQCSHIPHTQDQLNGKGQRVHTEGGVGKGQSSVKCTRCGHKVIRGTPK